MHSSKQAGKNSNYDEWHESLQWQHQAASTLMLCRQQLGYLSPACGGTHMHKHTLPHKLTYASSFTNASTCCVTQHIARIEPMFYKESPTHTIQMLTSGNSIHTTSSADMCATSPLSRQKASRPFRIRLIQHLWSRP